VASGYTLKPVSMKEPDTFLGAQVSRFIIDGAPDPEKPRWSMLSEKSQTGRFGRGTGAGRCRPMLTNTCDNAIVPGLVLPRAGSVALLYLVLATSHISHKSRCFPRD
jgi:hypothetical protein